MIRVEKGISSGRLPPLKAVPSLALNGKPGQNADRADASSTSVEQYSKASWAIPICWEEMKPAIFGCTGSA
jgi:hypothetical protein